MGEDEAADLVIREALDLIHVDMEAKGFRIVKIPDASSPATVALSDESTKKTEPRCSMGRTQNVAEFEELQSTQMETDQPLDDAPPNEDDIVHQSQRTEPSGKEVEVRSIST